MVRGVEGYSKSGETGEVSRLEKYRREVLSHVSGIHKRFDAQVAHRIGFDGSIVDAARKYIHGRTDISSMPSQIRQYVLHSSYSFDWQYKSADEELIGYTIGVNASFFGKERIELKAGDASLEFVTGEDVKEPVRINTVDLYSHGRSSVPTQRSIEFISKPSNMHEIIRVEQKKDPLVTISPLVYGDLDESGNVRLDLDQGIYAGGAHPQTMLEENGLVVVARKEKFYFPLIVNIHRELIDIGERLGV